MARGVPPDDGGRGAHRAEPAVRPEGDGVGPGAGVDDGGVRSHFLRLPPDVEGSRSLREGRPTAHPIPGARGGCFG